MFATMVRIVQPVLVMDEGILVAIIELRHILNMLSLLKNLALSVMEDGQQLIETALVYSRLWDEKQHLCKYFGRKKRGLHKNRKCIIQL